MAKEKHKKEEEDSDDGFPTTPGWMTTYSDMVQLLLTFFIMLISFSTINQLKFQQAAISLKGALGVLKRFPSPYNNLGLDIIPEDMKHRQLVMNDINEIQKKAMEMGIKDQLHIQATDIGLLIQLGDKVLFDLGKADLRPDAFPILEIVGKTIKNSASNVVVSGHTDNFPINTPEFPSNWELSTARALNVVKFFIEKTGVEPKLLSAAGYSEFRPIAPNDTPENRQRNRRVEFLITWQK